MVVFALGGGSRGDIYSLVFLRPVAVLVLGAGLLTIRGEHVRRNRWLFAIAGACVALPVIQLLPLPSSMVAGLAGRGILAQVDAVAGVAPAWRPITLTPQLTWNALWSMTVPLAALVWGAQLPTRDHSRVLGLLLLIGLVSGALALVQLSGDPNGPLYFYDDSNKAEAVGLFANRNHQALMLAMLFPMLAIWAGADRQRKSRRQARPFGRLAVAMVFGLCLLPMILLTGSRSGLAEGLIGLAGAAFLWWRMGGRFAGSGEGEQGGMRFAPTKLLAGTVALAGAVLVASAIVLGRAEALERLLRSRAGDEMRFKILPLMRDMTIEYWPWGSGIGSFKPVYRMHEPDGLIGPAIMNHAHNDLIEALLTGGVVAAAILAAATGLWAVRAATLLRQPRAPGADRLAECGVLMILMLAIGSLGDYPLRGPALACVLVCAGLWAAARPEPATRDDPVSRPAA